MGFRPEDISFSEEADIQMKLVVELIEYLGSEVIVYTKLADTQITIILKLGSNHTLRLHDSITLGVNLKSLYLFDTETQKRVIIS